ncbi:MAG: hypothetical protein GY754_25595 [bacterium]|nr:hypothetical protein [bacterium]
MITKFRCTPIKGGEPFEIEIDPAIDWNSAVMNCKVKLGLYHPDKGIVNINEYYQDGVYKRKWALYIPESGSLYP